VHGGVAHRVGEAGFGKFAGGDADLGGLFLLNPGGSRLSRELPARRRVAQPLIAPSEKRRARHRETPIVQMTKTHHGAVGARASDVAGRLAVVSVSSI
jgi:hypothetical protein